MKGFGKRVAINVEDFQNSIRILRRERSEPRRMAACSMLVAILRDAAYGRSSESDSKVIPLRSCSCETTGQQADRCDQDPGLGAGNGRLEVPCEATIASEPGEGALDHPSLGLGFERAYALRAGNDLDRPFAEFGDRVEQLRAAIDAVCEDVAQFWELPSEHGE